MRTLQLKQYESRVASLNNCYTHYSLIWEQFLADHGVLIGEQGKKLTTAVFPQNASAFHHDVLLERLESSHAETQSLLFKGIFLLSYGYYEQYLITLHQFAQKLDDSILDLQQGISAEEINGGQEDTKIIDKVLNRLSIPITSLLTTLEIDTLDYIRLRRNRATHIATTAQGVILEIINGKGTQLNKFWDANLRNKRNGLDFKRKQIDLFLMTEIVDITNIFKNILYKIDLAFITTIGEQRVMKYYLEEYKIHLLNKLKGITLAQRLRKFKNYARTQYEYSLSESEVNDLNLDKI